MLKRTALEPLYFIVANPSQSSLEHRLNSLESLMDDQSPRVRESVIAEIKRLGEPAHAMLELLALEGNSALSDIAEDILRETVAADSEAAFIRYIRSGKFDLEEGLILLERSVHPRVDPANVSAAIDGIAHRVQDLVALPTTPIQIVRALNRVFFHELGYRSETDEAPHPGSVLVGDVLALRRGTNVSLTLIYMLAARRLGMNFQPIVLPNYIFLAYLRDQEPFLVDPYSRGRYFSWEEAQGILPIGVMTETQYASERSTKLMLEMCCEHLAGIYNSRGDREREAVFESFCEEFSETSQQSRAS